MKKVWVKREDAYGKPSLCRQKKKLVLIIFVVIAILFFFYQFLFISLLTKSESDLGKKEQAKSITDRVSQDLNVNSVMDFATVFDDKGLVKGTRLMDLVNYKPNSDGKFTCFISKLEIDFSLVNDDFCDCPEDGSDEPGTNACERGHFYCKHQQRHQTGRGKAQKIPSSRVNDGICDCCDGSDEWRKLSLVHHLPIEVQKKLGRYQVPCPNGPINYEELLDSADPIENIQLTADTTFDDGNSSDFSVELLRNPKVENVKTEAKQFKENGETHTEEALQEFRYISKTLDATKPEENEFDCFGKSVACQLKKLPETSALESIAYIQSYLVKQRLKFLQPTT